MADIARNIIGCHSTQESRVQSALDDVVGNIGQALSYVRGGERGGWARGGWPKGGGPRDGGIGQAMGPPLMPAYRGGILRHARDLGRRLLAAFDTKTGMPYAWQGHAKNVRHVNDTHFQPPSLESNGNP